MTKLCHYFLGLSYSRFLCDSLVKIILVVIPCAFAEFNAASVNALVYHHSMQVVILWYETNLHRQKFYTNQTLYVYTAMDAPALS